MVKWLVKTESYQGESEHIFDSEKEAQKKYEEWSKWDGVCNAFTHKPRQIELHEEIKAS